MVDDEEPTPTRTDPGRSPASNIMSALDKDSPRKRFRQEAIPAAVALVGSIVAGLTALIVGIFSKSTPSSSPISDAAGSMSGTTTSTVTIVNGWPIAIGLVILAAVIGTSFWLRGVFANRRAAEAQVVAERRLADVQDVTDLIGFMRANASQMHAYDLMARRQAAQSHRASLVAMFVGLLLIGSGVAVAVLAPDAVSKIAGAGVTSIGATVGGFITRTFLINGRAAADNAAYYFQQPLVTSYLLSAERLVERAPDNTERTKLLSKIVEAALEQATASSRTAQPGAKGAISGRLSKRPTSGMGGATKTPLAEREG